MDDSVDSTKIDETFEKTNEFNISNAEITNCTYTETHVKAINKDNIDYPLSNDNGKLHKDNKDVVKLKFNERRINKNNFSIERSINRQENWKKFFYDKNSGSFFKRTPLSWLKIILFYSLFWSCLAGFFLGGMRVLDEFFNKDQPHLNSINGRNNLLINPGLTIIPNMDKISSSEYTFVRFLSLDFHSKFYQKFIYILLYIYTCMYILYFSHFVLILSIFINNFMKYTLLIFKRNLRKLQTL